MSRTRSLHVAVAAAVLLAACGTGGDPRQPQAGPVSGEPGSSGPSGAGGTVHVVYAGSLVDTMEHAVGPAFARTTGDDYEGYGAGSTQVANELEAKTRRGDVFLSADPEVNRRLMGTAGFVDWYATFARSPLVLGVNPHSRFADRLRTEPWYDVVTEPGFRLGRTDPTLDPKGELAAEAITQVAHDHHRPGLAGRIRHNATVFPEQDLVGRLQSGQLDAGFFYSIETSELHLPTVSLDPLDLGASYTVTVLNHASNRPGAVDLVRFLLGSRGRHLLREHGFRLVTPPEVAGDDAAVPAAVRAVVGTG